MLKLDTALKNLFKIDPELKPHAGDIRLHLERYNKALADIAGGEPLEKAVKAHKYFGFHRTRSGWVFREWLPGADAAWLTGDFNGWDKFSCPLTNIGNGVWEVKLPGRDALCHGQYIKLIVGRQGISFERIPAYCTRVDMDTSTWQLCGQIWAPEEKFRWGDRSWYGKKRPEAPYIYEAHIGMAQEKNGVGTYMEFAENTLPWIAEMGYNTIQLMAIQEHPYYASFGYQVTNFFAPSYRYGTPEELKYLINKAHRMGIAVILDVVHSHACPNEGEGLNKQDGTDGQYFLEGGRGWHSAWKTRCFDYGRREVLQFLLSNLKFWQDEYHFDGFRFDGVTSMLYEDHGLGVAFSNYSQYYTLNTNVDAKAYLMLANRLVHEVNPCAITIAEDMSGMPGMCLPLESAGMGFDYRLSMGMPDLWIKLIKETKMEHWDVWRIWLELTGGRQGEKSIAYCESHDQALVGDKTIIFRLADAEMYTGMERDYHSPVIDTATDMHKLIRFITLALGNGGYLNFMGNEFGHPEWIDFPREGNGWSYHYARRQWSLVQNENYKFRGLANFDRDMLALAKAHHIHLDEKPRSIWIDQERKLIIFERGDIIFAFNLHPTWSQQSQFVAAPAGGYEVIFSSDDPEYGGQGRVQKDYVYISKPEAEGQGFPIYLPCRTALVLRRLPNMKGAK